MHSHTPKLDLCLLIAKENKWNVLIIIYESIGTSKGWHIYYSTADVLPLGNMHYLNIYLQ